MASRFVIPNADVGNGIQPEDGAKLSFLETGTSTDKATFSDAAGTIPNANPVIADANGVFPDIFIVGTYKVILTDKNDVQTGFGEADPVDEFALNTINSYTQGSSGSNTRTLQNRLRDRASIFDFIPVAEHAAIIARTSTFDTQPSFVNALAANKSVWMPVGKYRLASTIAPTSKGAALIGEDGFETELAPDAGVDAVNARNSHQVFQDFQIVGGRNGLVVGDAISNKPNFVELRNVNTKDCSVDGIAVVQGNVGRIFGGLYETSGVVGLHFTADTNDTNGWIVVGTRTFGGPTGYFIEGDINNRFADDNQFMVTAEDYDLHGFRVSSIRNTIQLYAESLQEATTAVGYLDEAPRGANSLQMMGNTNVDTTNGTVHGLLQGISPQRFISTELYNLNGATFDITAASSSHQQLGFSNFTTIVNTSGSQRNLNLQKLTSHTLFTPIHFYIPATNTGDIVLNLDDPVGHTFLNGAGSIFIPKTFEDTYFILRRIKGTLWTAEEVGTYEVDDQEAAIDVTASTSTLFTSFKSKSKITITNTSGSTKTLTLNNIAGAPVGFKIYFVKPNVNAPVTLTLSSGTFIDNGTTETLGAGNSRDLVIMEKVSDSPLIFTTTHTT